MVILMVLTVIVLNQEEEFLQFLDTDLLKLKETHEKNGLRTLTVEYEFQELTEDKQLFQIGNKIWVSGAPKSQDCLYVINTEVSLDVYDDNQFSFEIEEVLVELNNAPLFSSTRLSEECFHTIITNGQREVYVDWNCLNAIFGKYFNIGVVQDCISDYAQRICLTGTQTLMNILRQIETETGNIFETRYEKDVITNEIHRYLDFLNPINVANDWELNLEYDFITPSNDAPTTEDRNWEVPPYEDGIPAESIPESVTTGDDPGPELPTGTEQPPIYDPETDEIPGNYRTSFTPYYNITPENTEFRIQSPDDETLFTWTSEDIDLDDTRKSILIQLKKFGTNIGVNISDKSYVVSGVDYNVEPTPAYISQEITPSTTFQVNLPDDSFFEIYDSVRGLVLFRTRINYSIGSVHEEILDFGKNIENVEYDVNEEDTVSAVSPILTISESGGNGLTNNQLEELISKWENLTIKKGTIVPMMVQKQTITADLTTKAKMQSFINSNNVVDSQGNISKYFQRPFNPNDNVDSETAANSTWEFNVGSAYWKAPYTKNAGQLWVETDKNHNVQYKNIHHRADIRDERGPGQTPKMGVTESSDEDVYAIYNQVCQYLKEHETPEVNVTVDVSTLRNGKVTQFNLHDKVYLKLPDSQELITARVVKTEKEFDDITKNTIELSNYVPLNTIKTIQDDSYIEAGNVNWKYPKTGKLTAKLHNSNNDADILANKLISFTLYKVENNSTTFTGKVYTKKTDYTGGANVTLNLNPGLYEMEIHFSGDELYNESSLSVDIRVGGEIPEPAQMKQKQNTTQNKTTRRTTTNTQYKKTYWTRCGNSPDKKKIVAVAKPSASRSDAQKRGLSMNQMYKTVFKNRCPECGSKGTLVFDGGKKNSCVKSAGAHGRGYKIAVPEHEITCNHCDSDYDGVTGLEKNYGHSTRLTTLEKPVKSGTSEFGKLIKGQLVYGQEKIKVKTQNNTNDKNRKIINSNISSSVKKQALAIAKNKTGQAAAKDISYWCRDHIKYDYYKNFDKSAATVLSRKAGNCCDQARLLAEMLDAAGLTAFYKIQYVYACCGTYHGQTVGHVYLKITTKKTGKSRYVDPCYTRGDCWGNHCNYGGVSKLTNYPARPF